ncbi:hypothetical protein [Streptomyces cellostaticus]|uniref:hypothetical protein n=1 Tax=Streptomyces TaxID=1883 RepID=UPI0020260799|nr:hypothetical protein [Streptomyces cellostaticus]
MRAGRSGFAVALAGALALGAYAAPSAAAADTGVTVSDLVVNEGKSVIVGTTAEVKPGFTFHMALPSGVRADDVTPFPYLYHDTTAAKGADSGGIYTGFTSCDAAGTRAAECTGELYIEPRWQLDSNNDATTWKAAVWVRVWNSNDQLKGEEYLTGFSSVPVKRAGKATVNASPEPVAKGGKLTVTGRLTRADWVKHTYTGFGGKAAKLQFRKAGTSTYSTVKIVRADSAGYLRTTTTAATDGYWRWIYSETSTTGGAKAAGDYVDVR